ncbi:hypothetical protein LMG28138_03270 [Pararobbsia alpina]|uniref:Uncharacterized protein n=1 Tax=Pararobbsia alpina TaxID=621374 RepID=A0A6S7BQH3_9BURK|nr:hypothetical protein LMG28138_03270 [Pararobbsia alpina]
MNESCVAAQSVVHQNFDLRFSRTTLQKLSTAMF